MTCWVQTFDGGRVVLPAAVGDTADFSELTLTALSEQMARVNRWGGATRKGYSLAQHCVTVSRLAWNIAVSNDLAPEDIVTARAWALLHDAHEIFTGDMAGPLKRALGGDHKRELHSLELRLDLCFRAWAGLPSNLPGVVRDYVKRGDVLAGRMEARDVCASPPRDDWNDAATLPEFNVAQPWNARQAARLFRKEFRLVFKEIPGAKKRAALAREAWANGGPAR